MEHQLQRPDQPPNKPPTKPEESGMNLRTLLIIVALALVAGFILSRLMSPSEQQGIPAPSEFQLNNWMADQYFEERLFFDAMLEHKKLYWPSQFIYKAEMEALCVGPYFIYYYNVDYPEMYQCEWRLVK